MVGTVRVPRIVRSSVVVLSICGGEVDDRFASRLMPYDELQGGSKCLAVQDGPDGKLRAP